MTTRRGFLAGLGSLIVSAPAIVHAGNLMPIKVVDWGAGLISEITITSAGSGYTTEPLLAAVTRAAFVPRLFVQIWNSTPLLAELEH